MNLRPGIWFLFVVLSIHITTFGDGHYIPSETAAIGLNKGDFKENLNTEDGSETETSSERTYVSSNQTTTTPDSLVVKENVEDQNKQLHLEVNQNSPYCQYGENVLTCDFHWSEKIVDVPALPNTGGPINELFIQNVHMLKLAQSCYSKLILHHIEEVLTIGDPPNPSCQDVIVRLLNVSLDQLPIGITSLYASNAKLARVNLGETAETISVTDSDIQFLSTNAETKRMQLRLQNTFIERVKNLRVSGNSALFIHNCSISDLPEKGIIIGTKGNILDEMTFSKEGVLTQEVILKSDADVAFGDFSGKLIIKAQPSIIPQYLETETAIPCRRNVTSFENYCSDTPHLILILLIFSLFLNTTQILFDQPGKFIKSIILAKIATRCSDAEESDKDDDDSIHSHEKPLLHDDYLLARRISSLDTLHTRRVSVVQVTKPVNNSGVDSTHMTIPVTKIESSQKEHHLKSIQKPIKHEHSSGRVHERSLQKHNFWKGHKTPQHPLKRSVTIGTIDVKYYNCKSDSTLNNTANNSGNYPLVDMKNASKSHPEL